MVKPFERNLSAEALRVILCDPRRDVVDAWIDHFRDVAAVEIVCGSLLDLRCDAIVSPANSFGDMSGGLDQIIDNHYQGAAQRAVVRCIREEFLGELPVGAALVVRTENSRLPLIVAAPTMREPGPVAGTINAYLATRAALVAAVRSDPEVSPIRRLAVPGLCTGWEGCIPDLPLDKCAPRTTTSSVASGKRSSIRPWPPFRSDRQGASGGCFPKGGGRTCEIGIRNANVALLESSNATCGLPPFQGY